MKKCLVNLFIALFVYIVHKQPFVWSREFSVKYLSPTKFAGPDCLQFWPALLKEGDGMLTNLLCTAFEMLQIKLSELFWVNGSFTENFYKRYGTSFQSVDMGCKHITSGIVCGGKQCYFVTVCQTLEWRIYNLAFNNLNIKKSFSEAQCM